MEKHHFKQAELWLNCAHYCCGLSEEGSEKYNVTVALSIHGIIKANDALSMKFLNRTARHHDEARELFEQLIKGNKIPAIYASYKNTLQEAIANKAKAEYRVAYFSKHDAEEMLRKAEKFMAMVRSIVQ